MQRAQVVVIGAGVIGCSIAWHLADRGCTDVIVIDRAPDLGGGSTARATGGFRCQFNTAINIRLSLLAREMLRRFHEEVGGDPGYVPAGYLFLARSAKILHELREANTLQVQCGVREARMISADEAHAISPSFVDPEVIGGAFCPTDGFIRPMQILHGYASAARRRGVQILFDADRTAFRTAGDRISGVETTQGPIACDTVVNAAGAWASLVSAVPVSPLRRQIASTVETNVLPATTPMTIWVDDGFHYRVRDGRVLLVWPDDPHTSDPYDTTFDDAWLTNVMRATGERVPCLRDIPIDRDRCWAGLYEMSPDRHAIIGRAPQYSNLFLANGSSGHGVMHSPAIGQIIAEMILDGHTSIDVSELRPSRFAEGKAIVSSELL
ncbi:MAG: NAD(P)/FAD-dependent oxidoreductase [Thermoanaerobaculia bacterium]